MSDWGGPGVSKEDSRYSLLKCLAKRKSRVLVGGGSGHFAKPTLRGSFRPLWHGAHCHTLDVMIARRRLVFCTSFKASLLQWKNFVLLFNASASPFVL